ncbi:MAG: hypothetical protein GQ574_18160 [Crocinitomix sp.]|nr:hypothetical protein [Crocinitomix sp.]
MSNDTGIFKGLNTELLRRLVIVIEMSCVLFGAIIYYQFPGTFFMFSPMLIVVHLITLLALPAVFKKLNKESQKELLHFSGVEEQDENLNEIDLWDRTAVGFYVLTNAVIVVILFVTLFL